MYKHKLMLPILAVIAGIAASAFTTAPVHQMSGSDEFWYQVDPSSHEVLSVIGQTTKTNAESMTNCNNTSSTLCAYGYAQDPGYSEGDIAAQGNDQFNKTQQ